LIGRFSEIIGINRIFKFKKSLNGKNSKQTAKFVNSSRFVKAVQKIKLKNRKTLEGVYKQ